MSKFHTTAFAIFADLDLTFKLVMLVSRQLSMLRVLHNMLHQGALVEANPTNWTLYQAGMLLLEMTRTFSQHHGLPTYNWLLSLFVSPY